MSFSVMGQKSLSLICHSGLDPESIFWIPASAGMTTFSEDSPFNHDNRH
jgi:hypothetical protein